MIGAFSFNGIPSSNFNLVCKSVNRPLLPPLKSNLTKMPGTSGVYDSGSTEYDLRQITMKIQYVGQQTGVDDTAAYYEMRQRQHAIAAWLGGGQWGKLVITGEEDKYYLAKIENDVELSTEFTFGEADIEFTCQPFAYAVTDVTVSGSGIFSFNNPGTRHIDSRSPTGSVFLLGCSGPNTITVNNTTLAYSGTGAITIDSVDMTVANGDFWDLTGDIDKFFTCKPGINQVSIANGPATIRFRPLYY